MLIGGYFGSWLPARAIPQLRLSPTELAEHGAGLGAGAIVALGRSVCPVAETSRVAEYFAAESAGQCGPCVNGLGAIADTMKQIASGTAPPAARRDSGTLEQLARRPRRLPVPRRRDPVRRQRAAGFRRRLRGSPAARPLRGLLGAAGPSRPSPAYGVARAM